MSARRGFTGPESRNTLKAQVLRRKMGSFFPGPNRTVVPKTTEEANRCILRHVAPKTLQKALYVGLSQIAQPLQVAYFGRPQFLFPEAPLAVPFAEVLDW
jgi:hypothetical protein